MPQVEIIKCHGSGNDFILIDATCDQMRGMDITHFTRWACDRERGIGSDGVLLLVRLSDGSYGMDMLNPDGTHAQMCGNGIRCVARLAEELGLHTGGILRSGGSDYPIGRGSDIAEGIKAYTVDIPIRLTSEDFAFFGSNDSFVGEIIPELDPTLRFTALNLGNPHIVAAVEHIDMALLESLGQRVKSLTSLFPHGVNVSLYECRSTNSIFVATYERGAGITLSCGTAMTASSTAAALLGHVESGRRIEVRNRGGKVYCTPTIDKHSIVTRLEGNATFDWWGVVDAEGDSYTYNIVRRSTEDARWQQFVQQLDL